MDRKLTGSAARAAFGAELRPGPEFAARLDAEDPLAGFRARFDLPRSGGDTAVYLVGNSLGPLPVAARQAQHHSIGRQIAAAGCAEDVTPVEIVVEIASAQIEISVWAKPVGLMNLKVNTDRGGHAVIPAPVCVQPGPALRGKPPGSARRDDPR